MSTESLDSDADSGINREAAEYCREHYDGAIAAAAEMLLQSEESKS